MLINPHETHQTGYTNPPLGLLYLAGTLLAHGIETEVVDACLEGRGAIEAALRTFGPTLAGITCLTPGRKRALEAARMVKAMDPSISVVMGGAHATIMYEQMLKAYPESVIGLGRNTQLRPPRPLPVRGVTQPSSKLPSVAITASRFSRSGELIGAPPSAWLTAALRWSRGAGHIGLSRRRRAERLESEPSAS